MAGGSHVRERRGDVENDQAIRYARIPGVFSGNVTVVNGTNLRLAHKLGRQPLGWSVTDLTGSVVVFYRVSWSPTLLELFPYFLGAVVDTTAAFEVW